jgi:hypothetical protein
MAEMGVRLFTAHAESGRSRDHDPATGVDPNCDIGRAVSWRPLPDPTADLERAGEKIGPF